MKNALLLLALLASSLACDDVPLGPGEQGNACDVESDEPCVAGLQCLVTSSEAPDDNGDLVCSTEESFCATACGLDSDCPGGQICILHCDDGDDGATTAGACFVGSSG